MSVYKLKRKTGSNTTEDIQLDYNTAIANKPTIPTNADYVDLTTSQTITGAKAFTGTVGNTQSSAGVYLGLDTNTNAENANMAIVSANTASYIDMGRPNVDYDFRIIKWNQAGNTNAQLVYGGNASGTITIPQKTGTMALTSDIPSSSGTDVQINGTSIVSNGVANILTNTAYNSSSNKIATMSDIPATYVSTVNGSSGAITDVAKTNVNNNFPHTTFSGSLEIFSDGSSWSEGIRIHPASNGWDGIVLCDSTNTGSTGTGANTWSIHNYNGTFGIYRNGSNTSATSYLSNVNGNWQMSNNLLLSGFIGSASNASYGLTLPSTSGWTANKTIATTDQVPSVWYGTQAQYDAITNKDSNTYYYIQEA